MYCARFKTSTIIESQGREIYVMCLLWLLNDIRYLEICLAHTHLLYALWSVKLRMRYDPYVLKTVCAMLPYPLMLEIFATIIYLNRHYIIDYFTYNSNYIQTQHCKFVAFIRPCLYTLCCVLHKAYSFKQWAWGHFVYTYIQLYVIKFNCINVANDDHFYWNSLACFNLTDTILFSLCWVF